MRKSSNERSRLNTAHFALWSEFKEPLWNKPELDDNHQVGGAASSVCRPVKVGDFVDRRISGHR